MKKRKVLRKARSAAAAPASKAKGTVAKGPPVGRPMGPPQMLPAPPEGFADGSYTAEDLYSPKGAATRSAIGGVLAGPAGAAAGLGRGHTGRNTLLGTLAGPVGSALGLFGSNDAPNYKKLANRAAIQQIAGYSSMTPQEQAAAIAKMQQAASGPGNKYNPQRAFQNINAANQGVPAAQMTPQTPTQQPGMAGMVGTLLQRAYGNKGQAAADKNMQNVQNVQTVQNAQRAAAGFADGRGLGEVPLLGASAPAAAGARGARAGASPVNVPGTTVPGMSIPVKMYGDGGKVIKTGTMPSVRDIKRR